MLSNHPRYGQLYFFVLCTFRSCFTLYLIETLVFVQQNILVLVKVYISLEIDIN